MKNPFEEYRAFSAWLIRVPRLYAMEHFFKCRMEGGRDNMAEKIAEYYKLPFLCTRAQLDMMLDQLESDSKNYDLSGFKFKGEE